MTWTRQLPGKMLARALEFLLEVNASPDISSLCQVVPCGLARLIDCDRASLNELDVAPQSIGIAPTPVPSWWAKYGAVYTTHLMDHPLWNPGHGFELNRSVSLDDQDVRRRWSMSPLNHEYFIQVGIKHQLATLAFQRGTTYVGIAVNRQEKGFNENDRALLELVSPHIGQAWRQRVELEQRFALWERGDEDACGPALLAIEPATGRIRPLSPTCTIMLRRFFGAAYASGTRLPSDAQGWLRSHVEGLRSNSGLSCRPLKPFVLTTAGGRAILHFVKMSPEEVILMVEVETCSRMEPDPSQPHMTPRENEVLEWMWAGKRNGEIARILGVSERTVEKHVEHVFQKLDVDNRVGAVRRLSELQARRVGRGPFSSGTAGPA